MISIEFFNKDKTLSYGNMDNEISGLSFTTLDPGGDATLSFGMPLRDSMEFYDDLKRGGIVAATYDTKEVWAGFINKPIGEGSGYVIQVNGFMDKMNKVRTKTNVPKGTLTNYIHNYILKDEALGLSPGLIGGGDTSDFVFPFGIDVSPTTSYSEIMEKGNASNLWYWGCRGNKLDFHPHEDNAVYWVHAADCDEDSRHIELSFECNRLWYSYSEDGAITKTDFVQNDSSIDKYGVFDGEVNIQWQMSPSQAQDLAEIILEDRVKIKPTSNITTSRIYTNDDTDELALPYARAGVPVCLMGQFSAAQSIIDSKRINDYSVFRVVGTQLDDTEGKITLSPGKLGGRADLKFAQMEASQNPNGNVA